MEDEVKESISDTYKCPECGAPMHFDPATNSLKCDYCDKIIKLESKSSTEELSFDKVTDEDTDKTWQASMQIFKCQGCGAENVVSKKVMSIVCPFCGSTQVVALDQIAGSKPNRVIPFKIVQEKAAQGYIMWLKKKILAPHKVKKDIPNVSLKGVYIPSWTYDTNTLSSYHGRIGKRYTRTVGSGKNRHTVTEIRWRNISGFKNVNFDDVLVQSGKKISQSELQAIEPFKTNESYVFDERYLAGFTAEHYSKNVKEGWKFAKEDIDGTIRSEILKGYNYDIVDYLNVSTKYDNITYKYVLLPVWIGKYEYHSKPYRFIVNGENSRFTGTYPKSVIRISFLVVLIAAIAVALIYFFYNFIIY